MLGSAEGVGKAAAAATGLYQVVVASGGHPSLGINIMVHFVHRVVCSSTNSIVKMT